MSAIFGKVKGLKRLYFFCAISWEWLRRLREVRDKLLSLVLLACPRSGRRPHSKQHVSLLDDELVGDVRGVVLQVHLRDVLVAGLDLGPAIDLEPKVLLHHVGVGVPHSDRGTLLDNIELLIKGHHLDASILVANEALSDTVETSTIVSAPLADDLDGLDTQVHVDTSAGLKLAHGDEDGLAQRRSLLLLLRRRRCGGCFHFA